LGGIVSNQGFEKLTGADADKFTLAGNKLTYCWLLYLGV
jgi:hypothetical protein